MTVAPMGDRPSGKSCCTTVEPSTATFALEARSLSPKNLPLATGQERMNVYVGATPVTVVCQLFSPATTCVRTVTCGDTLATPRSFAMANPSPGVSVDAPP